MIKIILTFVLVAVLASKSYSQEYLIEITHKTCKCIETTISEELDTQEFNMQVGACMIELSIPYKEEIKKDFDIDLDDIETTGAKWGEIIGVKLASICPNSLVKIAKAQQPNGSKISEKTSSGIITKIENDYFVVLHLKDETGTQMKFHWLSNINSDKDLISSYSKLKGSTVQITYTDQDFFDPKIGQYRSYHILAEIKFN